MTEITRKIKFVDDYEVDDARKGTDRAEKYKKDQVVPKMNQASAAHFVSRGLAEYADQG